MHYAELTNEELVGLAQQGDEKAFTFLFNRNLSIVICHANRNLNNLHDAEEVALKFFKNTWDNIHKLDFSGDRKFLGWMTVVVTRNAIDKSRLRISYWNALDRHELAYIEYNNQSHDYIEDLVTIGEKIIARLPGLQRKSIELTFHGMTEREIAGKLGKSRSTIHQAINGALRNIKALTPTNLN